MPAGMSDDRVDLIVRVFQHKGGHCALCGRELQGEHTTVESKDGKYHGDYCSRHLLSTIQSHCKIWFGSPVTLNVQKVG
jgi:hypothetical protein